MNGNTADLLTDKKLQSYL